jgi:hypothetical protein
MAAGVQDSIEDGSPTTCTFLKGDLVWTEEVAWTEETACQCE